MIYPARLVADSNATLLATFPDFPEAATFGANVVGAFLLGYFTTRLLERLPVSSYRRPLLGTGLCGALTTFSTLQVEILRMFEHGRPGLAVGATCGGATPGASAWV